MLPYVAASAAVAASLVAGAPSSAKVGRAVPWRTIQEVVEPAPFVAGVLRGPAVIPEPAYPPWEIAAPAAPLPTVNFPAREEAVVGLEPGITAVVDVASRSAVLDEEVVSVVEPPLSPDFVEPLAVQRMLECPPGYELVNKQCVRVETQSPNFVCPGGTVDREGRCLSFARATPVCHHQGATLTANLECELFDVTAAARVCDDGFTLEVVNGEQICKKEIPVPPVCPANFLETDDGSCVHVTPIEKMCPPGFKLTGKDCSRPVAFPAEALCPPEFFLDSLTNECTQFVPVPPRCDAHGHVLAGDECLAPVERIADICPPGHDEHEDGISCTRVLAVEAVPVCEEGYSLLADNRCHRAVAVSPICPEGTMRGPTGECELLLPRVAVCDEDEELLTSGLCRREKYYVADLECPPEFTLVHGKCKKVVVNGAVPRCSVGVLEDGSCVTTSSSVPLLVCPLGYTMAAGPTCVRDVDYDCSTTVTTTECDMPSFVPTVLEQTLRGDYKQKINLMVAPLHVKGLVEKEPDSKLPNCAPVTRTLHRTCTRQENVAPDLMCPPDAELVGSQCVVKTALPAVPVCEKGHFDKATGQCMTLTTMPARSVCALGTLQADGNCLAIAQRPADFVCPELTLERDGLCLTIHEEVRFPDEVHYTEPELVCEVGTINKLGEQTYVCEIVETVVRELVCPEGSEERDGVCVITSAVVYPEDLILRREPAFVCPDGSPAPEAQCWRTEVVPNSYVCREGRQEGGRCIAEAAKEPQPPIVDVEPSKPVCHHGYELLRNPDRCSSRYAFAVDFECPAGFFPNGAEREVCVQDHARTPICPAGTETVPNGCQRKALLPPRVTEIKVCTAGQPGC